MPVVTIIIKPFPTFRDGQKVIIATGSPYVKKISSSFPGPDPFAINTFNFLFVVFVRHGYLVLVKSSLKTMMHKYIITFQLPKYLKKVSKKIILQRFGKV
jgi:hypothetical protein